jgi:hypothetical protein
MEALIRKQYKNSLSCDAFCLQCIGSMVQDPDFALTQREQFFISNTQHSKKKIIIGKNNNIKI